MSANNAPLIQNNVGVVQTIAGSVLSYAKSVLVEPNGNIIVVGSCDNGSGYDIVAVRYLPDGSIDTSFGGGDGIVISSISSGSDYGNSIIRDSDGKIVVAGFSEDGLTTDFTLLRYNSDGTLDTSFSTDGIATTNLSNNDYGRSVSFQSDGKVIVAGDTANGVGVVRYLTDGTIDTSFGTSGSAETIIGSYSTYGSDLIVQDDNSIIVVGSTSDVSGESDIILVRYDADGGLDTTFGTNGIVRTSISSGNDEGNSVTLLSDGRILVSGSSNNGSDADFALLCYNANGTLDTTFGGGDGIVTTPIGNGGDYGYSVEVDSNGKIIVGGFTDDYFAAVRYNADGTLDTSFGTGGTVSTDISGAGWGMALDQDNNIILSGGGGIGGDYDITLIRLNHADGSVDTTFGGSNSLDNSISYIEDSFPVLLAPRITVSDEEFDLAGNYSGMSVTLSRNGGANSDDQFSGAGIVAGSTSGVVNISGFDIGSYTYSTGLLTLTFDSDATGTLLNEALRSITYSNSSNTPQATIQIDWTINDGINSSTGITTISIIDTYDVPNTAPTFAAQSGGVGYVRADTTTNIYNKNNDGAKSFVFQEDGKIVLVGRAGSTDFGVVRFNADGTLDSTFGGDGIVTTPISSSHDYGEDVIIQSDGKILVAGRAQTSGYDFAVVRYNTDGSLDTTFGGNGTVTTDFGYYDYGNAIALQNDGKIVVAGGNDIFLVARYNTDGSLDTSFDSDGKVTTTIGNSSSARAMVIQDDGKIVVLGESTSTSSDWTLVRYNTDGSLDTTFSGDGIVTKDLNNKNQYGNALTLQSDGKIIVAGYTYNDTNGYDIVLLRYNTDGTLDTTFSGDGIVTTTVLKYNQLNAVTVQSDGKILVTGTVDNTGTGQDLALLRYNSDGSLDTSFGGGDGIVTLPIGLYGDYGYDVKVDENGKIWVAGEAYLNGSSDFILLRFNSDGTIDDTFGTPSSLDAVVTHTQGVPTILDSNVQIYDAESSISGYAGASLVLVRQGGASNDDKFSGAGIVANQSSGNVTVAATTIGTYLYSNGTLTITFNSNATQSLVNQAMQAIEYSNIGSNPPSSIAISWTFSDGDGGSTSGSNTVTIIPGDINHAPTASNTTINMSEDTVKTGTLPTATDSDGDTIAYSVATPPSHGVLNIASNGSYSYTPTADYFGNDSFTYTISDTNGGSNTYTVSITITDVAEPQIEFIGTETNNTLTGNAANNILNGLAGTDTMTGGLGNDTYYVDNTGDKVIETSTLLNEIDTVYSSVTYTLGSNVENLTLEGNDNINGYGNTLANTLIGNDGNNILDGKTGADTMSGGLGDDTYTIDNIDDVITENADEGNDTIVSSINFDLSSGNLHLYIENLTLSGSAALEAVGNDLDNTLIGNTGANTLEGNDGNDTLDGGKGSDVMEGGAGDDIYYVDNAADIVTELENEGDDSVYSTLTYSLTSHVENLTLIGTASNKAYGNDLDNTLEGNKGNNLLDGKTGADTMIGGLGKDTYYVDNVNDSVIEDSMLTTEADTVISSVSFTLGDYVENLTLVEVLAGDNDIDAIGNALNNILKGNSGNNILNGGAGVDKMTGGLGDDTYYIDIISDKVTEAANAGEDTVISSIDYILKTNFENLTLEGSAISATGNKVANIIIGNDSNNILNGKEGNDTLTGGEGNDTFVFSTKLSTATVFNMDTITDFTVGEDTIQLENAIFKKLTTATFDATTKALFSDYFVSNETGTAQDANDYIVYNNSTGQLFYDIDGNTAGGIAAVQIAVLTGQPIISAVDFWVS